MAKETNLIFDKTESTHGIIEKWAKENGFKLRNSESSSNSSVYQRGSGFLTAPMKVKFVEEGDQIYLTAWIHINVIFRIFTLGLMSSTMGVESGGFMGVLPRKIARDAVNKLLRELGVDEIK